MKHTELLKGLISLISSMWMCISAIVDGTSYFSHVWQVLDICISQHGMQNLHRMFILVYNAPSHLGRSAHCKLIWALFCFNLMDARKHVVILGIDQLVVS